MYWTNGWPAHLDCDGCEPVRADRDHRPRPRRRGTGRRRRRTRSAGCTRSGTSTPRCGARTGRWRMHSQAPRLEHGAVVEPSPFLFRLPPQPSNAVASARTTTWWRAAVIGELRAYQSGSGGGTQARRQAANGDGVAGLRQSHAWQKLQSISEQEPVLCRFARQAATQVGFAAASQSALRIPDERLADALGLHGRQLGGAGGDHRLVVPAGEEASAAADALDRRARVALGRAPAGLAARRAAIEGGDALAAVHRAARRGAARPGRPRGARRPGRPAARAASRATPAIRVRTQAASAGSETDDQASDTDELRCETHGKLA